MSSVLSARNVLPVVTAIVATLFLITATPHDLLPEQVAAVDLSTLAGAEVQRCVAQGRGDDACLDEVDGKDLIERADDVSRRASR